MSTQTQNTESEKTSILLKCFAIFMFFVQIVRITGTGVILFVVYDTLLVKKQTSALFDEYDCEVADDHEDSGELTKIERRYVEEHDKAKPSEDLWQDFALIFIPCLEISTVLSLVYLIMGPFSRGISAKRWLIWLIRMRVFWMRMLWTSTAIAYCVITYLYRQEMYEITGKPKYSDNSLDLAMMGLITVEYFCLGLLQCSMKIMDFDTIRKKIIKKQSFMFNLWAKFFLLSFYICVLAFAVRNFSMSFYFGLLSVYASVQEEDDPDGKSVYFGVVLVIQIYLSLIRGRFYGFFMRCFLSTFLLEEDNSIYDQGREIDDDQSQEGRIAQVTEKPIRETGHNPA